MDFGTVMGIDGLVSSSSEIGVGGSCGVFSSSLVFSSDIDSIRQKGLYRSGFLKHARPGESEENDWMCLKAPRSEVAMMAPTKSSPSLISPNSHSLFPEGQQMLSFSSPKPDSLMLCNDGGLTYYHPSGSSFSLSSSSYTRNAGVRGPFTPSQWMELEHQALIYKYIDANVPVPSSLLVAIRKSLGSSGFPSYSPGSLRATELGWSPFHLGFSGNADPEPGRCRRTDGKKWRCSRDAVADQKYCERHMNRGRHRSRKPVEGHSGHAAKAMPIISPTASVSAGGSSNNSLSISHQQIKSLQQHNPTSASPFSRIPMNKENVNGDELGRSQSLLMTTAPSAHQKPKDGSLFPLPRQRNPFEDDRATPQPNPLRHFFDDWPKDQSNRSVISWPEVEEIQSDRTQLSISIPMASSEFSSSSSSPARERAAALSSKISREADPTHMGLGVGQREASWIPVSWESSMGGPLGEVLNKTSSNPNGGGHSKNPSPSSLNLMTEAWDNTSPGVGSSPTGVLQKSTTFASLSGSTGSSPRADANRVAHDSTGSLCDNLLGSTLVNSTSIPTL